jgi:hypothetical protein
MATPSVFQKCTAISQMTRLASSEIKRELVLLIKNVVGGASSYQGSRGRFGSLERRAKLLESLVSSPTLTRVIISKNRVRRETGKE